MYTAQVGEVGWMVDDTLHNTVNEGALKSGHQIQLKVYRKSLEDNATNRALHATRLDFEEFLVWR